MSAPHLTIGMMSTRLFPKNRGAEAYRITGIAARCDWVLSSDRKHPKVKLVKQNNEDSPRSVFLSLRDPSEAIAFFMENVLPSITSRFILVSGSEDIATILDNEVPESDLIELIQQHAFVACVELFDPATTVRPRIASPRYPSWHFSAADCVCTRKTGTSGLPPRREGFHASRPIPAGHFVGGNRATRARSRKL